MNLRPQSSWKIFVVQISATLSKRPMFIVKSRNMQGRVLIWRQNRSYRRNRGNVPVTIIHAHYCNTGSIGNILFNTKQKHIASTPIYPSSLHSHNLTEPNKVGAFLKEQMMQIASHTHCCCSSFAEFSQYRQAIDFSCSTQWAKETGTGIDIRVGT